MYYVGKVSDSIQHAFVSTIDNKRSITAVESNGSGLILIMAMNYAGL